MLHDLHEAVTGDILPMFKTVEIRKRVERMQNRILKSLGASEDKTIKKDLKLVDLIAFLYEIKQVSPNILIPNKLLLTKKLQKNN